VSENMEVVYDLDVEIGDLCRELGLNMVRAAVVAGHPRFVRMIRELIVERIQRLPERPALGSRGPSHDVCPPDCCDGAACTRSSSRFMLDRLSTIRK